MTARLALVVACVLTACTNDYDKFEVVNDGQDSGLGGTGGGTGGTTGGAGGSGGVGGTGGVGNIGGGGAPGGTGGTGGISGSGGTGGSSCNAGQKPCAASCVPDDDPATGCAQVSCDPCSIANGTATCASGACAVESCNTGFGDCAGGAADGCEQNLAQPNNASCGSCANDCTNQGFATHFSCGSNLICQCTSADQCKDGGNGTAACAGGLCSCSGTACNGGERCRKSGPNQVCSCNGGAACVAGQVCCQTPAGCKDLTTDAGNCGACGKVCPGGTTCVSGSCQ